MKNHLQVIDFINYLAERVGFEPTVPCGTPDFESGTFGHSAISPRTRDCISGLLGFGLSPGLANGLHCRFDICAADTACQLQLPRHIGQCTGAEGL